jgi:mono/diheme cytochrome c family protein
MDINMDKDMGQSMGHNMGQWSMVNGQWNRFCSLFTVHRSPFTLLLLLSLLCFSPVHAVSQTGLSSSLIKEWHSEVDRKKCPDFRYPSHPPSIITGETVYKANCASCHGATPSKTTGIVDSMRKGSPEKHFETVCGGTHNFANTLTVDERWDSLMYMNTQILGFYPTGSAEAAKLDATFGGNCAICHGTRGQGDGNLHKMLLPAPANFNLYQRLYTRSDERLFNEISYGIPWTGMPAWKDRHDFDKQEDFTPELIWKLVRYVRGFAYSQEIDRLDIGRERLRNK